MRRGDDALATISLVSRLCADRVQPLKASEFWKLSARLGTGPSCLLGMNADDLSAAHDFSGDFAQRIGGLMGRATALAFELERLEQSGIGTLTPFDEHYPTRWPERLGPKAPPLLYAAGAIELLDTAGLGVVGSRDVSPTWRQGRHRGGQVRSRPQHSSRFGRGSRRRSTRNEFGP